MRNNAAQKKLARRLTAPRTAASIILLLLAASASAAPLPIQLGEAEKITILGASTVTNAGPTKVIGNLAISPGVSVNGFPPGTIVGGSIHIGDALAT